MIINERQDDINQRSLKCTIMEIEKTLIREGNTKGNRSIPVGSKKSSCKSCSARLSPCEYGLSMIYDNMIYRVFHSIWTQKWGYCELDLGLLRSQRASMWPQDWAQITFRSETHRNKFCSEPRRRLKKEELQDLVIWGGFPGYLRNVLLDPGQIFSLSHYNLLFSLMPSL